MTGKLGELDHDEAIHAFEEHAKDSGISQEELKELRPWHEMPWKKEHICKLKPGDPAPNSKCITMDGIETTLYEYLYPTKDDSDEKAKNNNMPIVIVFGSITCPDFRNYFLKEFVDIVNEHKGTIRLVVVYLAEAHPKNGWQVARNVTQNIRINQHVTKHDRITAAQELVQLHPEIQNNIIVDSMENRCDHDYEAQTSRTYVIHNQTIVYQSHVGPFKISPSSLQAFLWEWTKTSSSSTTSTSGASSGVDDAILEEDES